MAAAVEDANIVLHIKITESRGGRDPNVIAQGLTTTIFQKPSEILVDNRNTTGPPPLTINLRNLEWFSSFGQQDMLR